MTIGQLMKNLRAKGWIPRGYNEVIHAVYDKKHKMIGLYKEGKEYLHLVYKKSLRELVSKESGLRQFVCENGMVDNSNFYTREKVDEDRDWIDVTYSTIVEEKKGGHYQYRLIESSLKNEDELEQFLLDNIKVEGKND